MPLAVHGWPRLHLLLGAWAAFGPATFASAATNTPGLSVLLRAASSTTRSGGGRGFANWISLQIGKIGADDRIYAPYGQRGRVCLEGSTFGGARLRPSSRNSGTTSTPITSRTSGAIASTPAPVPTSSARCSPVRGQQSAQTLPRRCPVMLLPDELSRLAEALPDGI